LPTARMAMFRRLVPRSGVADVADNRERRVGRERRCEMTAQTGAGAAGGAASPEVACWCCGERHQELDVVRLGEHPEVAVCHGCAHFLHQRARAQEDAARPSPATRVRDLLRATRELVIRRGWHTRPVIGPLLRRLGTRLP
jgi:hypothetical protein